MSCTSRGVSHADKYIELLSIFIQQTRPQVQTHIRDRLSHNRQFHDYFVTHLPSSSLHPDSRSGTGLAHKFPRKESKPHPATDKTAPATHPSISRDTTVVRIPLRSAKHHFGASVSRGSRPYNEDSHQAGVIELPAFAKRPPRSLTVANKSTEATSADGASGDPQVFYFGVFDGHGGAECSGYLRERLHEYIEQTAKNFDFKSTLKDQKDKERALESKGREQAAQGKETPASIEITKQEGSQTKQKSHDGPGKEQNTPQAGSRYPLNEQIDTQDMIRNLEKDLVRKWRDLVGGYFRRFKPAYFSLYESDQLQREELNTSKASRNDINAGTGMEEVIAYSFLKADYDFVAAQAAKQDLSKDNVNAERPLNDGDILHNPSLVAAHIGRQIGGSKRFMGGSTCSVAMVSTPTPTPFWNPSTTSSMLVAHVGDTRILVCSTSTGQAIPLTSVHHPSSPVESNRLRRYAATFVTDSFGEERISGLANTRAFGDIASKRVGVSAEPEITRIEIGAAEYSFMVLVSDGITGTLNDQEIVDIVKEAKTPDQAARDVVSFATEVTQDGDNATCLVVRLGGWERRQEGGHGSLSTKESRDFKRQDASDPRGRRQ